MSRLPTDELIASLAANAHPVRPLRPPFWRGLGALVLLAMAAGAVILLFGDVPGLLARYSGREQLMLFETGAMLLTAIFAIFGAFFVSIPGRSRLWLLAPLPAFAAWLGLSGLGCYQDLVRLGSGGLAFGDTITCFTLLLAGGLLVGVPLLWQLARSRPVDPLPVAVLGGLGAAAASAFLLQFFHPFALTAIDLGVHMAGVVLIIATASILRRRALSPG